MSDAVTDIGLTFPFITLWNACSSPSNTTACAKRRKTYPCLHTLTQTKHCRTRMCTKRMVTVSRGNTTKSNWFSWKDVKEKLSCFHLCKYLQSVRHFVRYSNTRMLHCYLLSMNQNEAISCCLQGNKKSSLVTKFTEITDSNSCLSNTSWMLLPTKLRGHMLWARQIFMDFSFPSRNLIAIQLWCWIPWKSESFRLFFFQLTCEDLVVAWWSKIKICSRVVSCNFLSANQNKAINLQRHSFPNFPRANNASDGLEN